MMSLKQKNQFRHKLFTGAIFCGSNMAASSRDDSNHDTANWAKKCKKTVQCTRNNMYVSRISAYILQESRDVAESTARCRCKLFGRTSTSVYDENKLCLSYLQPKFTKVSTECVIDSRKRKQ